MEVIEVEPARLRRECRDCGADRDPKATYCASCKAARLTVQWRDQKARHRARKLAQAAEHAKAEAADRRKAYLREHGW